MNTLSDSGPQRLAMYTDIEQSAQQKLEMAPEISELDPEIDAQSNPKDEFIVDWVSDDDQDNPQNWTPTKKGTNVALFSALGLLTPVASAMFAPGIPTAFASFASTNESMASFLIGAYLIGYVAGPLYCPPLSEIYGRIPVYVTTNTLFLAFTVICAVAPLSVSLIVFRLLAGVAGSAHLVLYTGSVADLYTQEARGKLAWYVMGMLIPIFGPVAGACLASNEATRWVFWVMAIASGVVTVFFPILGHETYAPVILERKASKLRRMTGDPSYRSALTSSSSDFPSSGKVLILMLIRPVKLCFASPGTFAFCAYIAVVYEYLFLLLTPFVDNNRASV